MDVKFDKIDNVYAMLTINLDEKDYQDKVKKQLREIGQRRPEPGFRPGHVPAGLLQKKYGTAVKYDVVNREVSEALYNYVKDNNIKTLGDPVPQKNDDFNIDNTEFSFSFKVGLYPELNLNVDKNLKVAYYNIEVSEEMVTRQSDMLRNRFGKQEPGEQVEANALVKGEIAELNEDGSLKEGGIVVEDGIVSPQYFKSEEQRNIFVGKKPGEVVRFNPAATCDGNDAELSSMLNIDKEAVADHKGDFNFTIKEALVLRPAELNQEFFDNALGKDQAHNEEEYKEVLKKIIANQLSSDSNYRFSIDAKDALMNIAGEIQLPAETLKEVIKMNNEGITEENIEEKYTSFEPQLKWYVVRDTVAEALKIKVEQADLIATASLIARQQFAQYGMTNVPDDAIEGYAKRILEDKNSREQIANNAYEMKFFQTVKEAVTLEEKTVNADEFNALFKPTEETAE